MNRVLLVKAGKPEDFNGAIPSRALRTHLDLVKQYIKAYLLSENRVPIYVSTNYINTLTARALEAEIDHPFVKTCLVVEELEELEERVGAEWEEVERLDQEIEYISAGKQMFIYVASPQIVVGYWRHFLQERFHQDPSEIQKHEQKAQAAEFIHLIQESKRCKYLPPSTVYEAQGIAPRLFKALDVRLF
jgi:hypothetical protein